MNFLRNRPLLIPLNHQRQLIADWFGFDRESCREFVSVGLDEPGPELDVAGELAEHCGVGAGRV